MIRSKTFKYFILSFVAIFVIVKFTQYVYPSAAIISKITHLSENRAAGEIGKIPYSYTRQIEKSFEERLSAQHVPHVQFSGLIFFCMAAAALLLSCFFARLKSFVFISDQKQSCYLRLCVLRI